MGLKKHEKRCLDELRVQITLCSVRDDLQPLGRMAGLVGQLLRTQAHVIPPPSECRSEKALLEKDEPAQPTINLHIEKLIDKLNIHSGEHIDKEELQKDLKNRLVEVLKIAFATTTEAAPDSTISRADNLSRKALEHHYTTTVGLWCIDRDPKEVTSEWIRENAFQISPIGPESKL